MEMGILGLPQSGKSTLFEIMTGVKSSQSHNEAVVRGQASVPDERFGKLVEIYKPVKVSPAKVPFSDVHAVGVRHRGTTTPQVGAVEHVVVHQGRHMQQFHRGRSAKDLLAGGIAAVLKRAGLACAPYRAVRSCHVSTPEAEQ